MFPPPGPKEAREAKQCNQRRVRRTAVAVSEGKSQGRNPDPEGKRVWEPPSKTTPSVSRALLHAVGTPIGGP